MLYKLLIDGVFLFIICVFGLLANSITLYILNSGHEMRSQTINIYLSFLAIYDNGVLFTGILMFSLPAVSHLLHLSSQVSLEESSYPINSKEHLDLIESIFNSGTTELSQTPLIHLNEQFINQFRHIFNNQSSNNVLTYNKSSSNFQGANPQVVVSRSENRRKRREDIEPVGKDEGNENDYLNEDEFENPSHYYISFVYPLALAVQTGSIWTTCLVTVERYWAVTYPLRAMVLSTRRRALIALTVVSIISIVYNLPRFFEVEIQTDDRTGVRMIVQSELRLNETYRLVYYIALNLLLTHVIPLSTLTVLNFKIHKQIKAANINRAQLSASQRSELNVSSMLMILVLIFIICNTPAFIVNVLEVIQFNSTFIDFCATISNVLVCINSSVNFLIYCIHGRVFRTKFIRIITCNRSRIRVDEVSTAQPSHIYVTNNHGHRSASPSCIIGGNEEINLDMMDDRVGGNGRAEKCTIAETRV